MRLTPLAALWTFPLVQVAKGACTSSQGITGVSFPVPGLPVWNCHHAGPGKPLWAQFTMGTSSVPALMLCEFVGCLLSVPQGGVHMFCLRHASCWVGETFDPLSCGISSPHVILLTHSPLEVQKYQAATTLHLRFPVL